MITLKFQGFTWQGESFAQFVSEFYHQINDARKNGYSWRQIAHVVQSAMDTHVADLHDILRDRFVWEIGLRDQINNKGIRDFIRKHFNEIKDLRDNGFSWFWIADNFKHNFGLQLHNLAHSLATTFSALSHEEKHK